MEGIDNSDDEILSQISRLVSPERKSHKRSTKVIQEGREQERIMEDSDFQFNSEDEGGSILVRDYEEKSTKNKRKIKEATDTDSEHEEEEEESEQESDTESLKKNSKRRKNKEAIQEMHLEVLKKEILKEVNGIDKKFIKITSKLMRF